MTYSPGDVILIEYPFTDGIGKKKRPALVVSPPEFSAMFGDIVLLQLTSVEQDPSLELSG